MIIRWVGLITKLPVSSIMPRQIHTLPIIHSPFPWLLSGAVLRKINYTTSHSHTQKSKETTSVNNSLILASRHNLNNLRALKGRGQPLYSCSLCVGRLHTYTHIYIPLLPRVPACHLETPVRHCYIQHMHFDLGGEGSRGEVKVHPPMTMQYLLFSS